jgi:hypothetical protein
VFFVARGLSLSSLFLDICEISRFFAEFQNGFSGAALVAVGEQLPLVLNKENNN